MLQIMMYKGRLFLRRDRIPPVIQGILGLFLAGSFFFLSISSCFASSDNSNSNIIQFSNAERTWLKQHPVVTVRISREYPPFEFYKDGKFQGIAVDYLNLLSERLGIDFIPAPDMPWSNVLENLRQGQGVDMVLLITHTHEREKFMRFTNDYISFPQVIFTTRNSPFISGIHDLGDKLVAVESGYIMKSWLEKDVPGVKFLEVNSSEEALKAVSDGEADAYVGDLAVGQYFIEKKGFINLMVAAPTSYDVDSMAMGVRKDWPELVGLFDKALSSLSIKERNAIKQRWLTIRYEYGIRFLDIVKWVLIVSVIALAWIIHLRIVVERKTDSLIEEMAERERADKALLVSERNYREIYNATNEAIFVHDAKTGKVLDVNQAMLEMFHCSYEEALSLSLSDFSTDEPPYTQLEAAENIKKAIHEGPHTFEWRSKRLTGEVFWTEVSLKSSQIGGEGRVLAVVRDISERKRIEQELHEELELSNEFLNILPGTFFMYDEHGRIVRSNNGYKNYLGYSEEDREMMSPTDFVPEYEKSRVTQAFNTCLQEGKASLEAKLLSKSGEEIPFLIQTFRLIRNGQKYVVGLSFDISNLRKTEESLRESEARLRQLSEATFEGIAITENGIFIDANSQLADLLGYEQVELIGKNVSDFVAPESQELVRQHLKSGSTDAYEHLALKKDGSRIYVQARGHNARYKDKDVRLTTIRDITEQKQAENDLRASEEKFSKVFYASPHAIVISSLEDGQIQDVNEGFERLSGYSRKEAIGKTTSELKFWADDFNRDQYVKNLKASGYVRNFEMLGRTKAGELRNVSISSEVLELVGRRQLVTTIVDVTELKSAQVALTEHKERLELLIERMPAGCIFWDMDFKAQLWNPMAEEIFGFTKDEAIGKHAYEIIVPDSFKPHVDEIWTKLTRGDKTAHSINDNITKDGKTIVCEWYNTPIIQEGVVIGVVSMVNDITERRQTEESILESRERYKQLFESANDGILIMKEDTFIDCNTRALEIYGCTREQLIGHTPYEFSPPEQPDGLDSIEKAKGLINAAIEGSQKSFEWFHKKFDGTPFYAEVSLNAIELASGTHVQAIVRDITERKVIEEALIQSEEKYRELVEKQTDFIVRWKPDTRRTYVNKAYCDYFGITYDNAVGSSFISLMSETERERLASRIKSFTPDNAVLSAETRVKRPDGSTGWNLWTDTAIFDNDGKLLEVQSIGRDITEKKEFEEALRIQAQIVNQIHDSVISSDMDGNITSWNKGAERLYGYASEEVLGKHISIIYPKERYEFLKQQIIDPLMIKGFHETEDLCLRKDGRLVNTHLSLSLIRDHEGKPVGMIGYSHDITEKKVAERSAHLASIGELAAGVAHEINNPTNSIMLNAGLINDYIDVSKDKVLSLGERILKDSERISKIVTSLLSFSRVESLDKINVDIVALLDDVGPLVRDRLKKHSVQYTILDEPDVPQVRVNKQKIEQVFINLINNSIDALNAKFGTDPSSKILTVSVGTKEKDNSRYALIKIQDNGTGIPLSLIDKVREPFFTTKPEHMGTGLGLSISHGIIEEHGGEMIIESEEGQYTIISILLPERNPHE